MPGVARGIKKNRENIFECIVLLYRLFITNMNLVSLVSYKSKGIKWVFLAVFQYSSIPVCQYSRKILKTKILGIEHKKTHFKEL